MKLVTIAEASEKLSELFDAALRGEEVIITKVDKPNGMALLRTSIELTPTTTVKSRQPGSAKVKFGCLKILMNHWKNLKTMLNFALNLVVPKD